jgi:hypothetical protein
MGALLFIMFLLTELRHHVLYYEREALALHRKAQQPRLLEKPGLALGPGEVGDDRKRDRGDYSPAERAGQDPERDPKAPR